MISPLAEQLEVRISEAVLLAHQEESDCLKSPSRSSSSTSRTWSWEDMVVDDDDMYWEMMLKDYVGGSCSFTGP